MHKVVKMPNRMTSSIFVLLSNIRYNFEETKASSLRSFKASANEKYLGLEQSITSTVDYFDDKLCHLNLYCIPQVQ